ncbi:MarR family winged helix-turn-helix transcriptional regulator [Gulosibacter chungangensis]|uniref:MarR family transcriptional regulator n=1 Tax=Gulosibacter chungangensis TaxID=979746 RepID=A0A7J5BF62_9MICO|nr:MarR family transcriptional regulator [Gulosibacter chungangensis]KAB1644901.1 MarR family transcriptional regulator [Gulosibacter chungangensis]
MDTETLFHKFRHISRLMKPRGRRGGQPGGPGRGFGTGPGGRHYGEPQVADPTRGQGRIIAALKLQDAVPTKDLAYILGMRVASLNELLGKLERAELITREPSEADKRVILIKLTEEGRSTEQFKPQRPDAFSTLSEEEQEQLGEYLDRIIEHLESQLGDADEAPDEDFERWSEQARARMGEENFARWMSRMSEYEPEGYAGMYSRRFGGPGRGGHGHEGHGRGHGHGYGREHH